MNPPQSNIQFAVEHGWISAPQPMKLTVDKWRELKHVQGLTAHGTPRKPHRSIPTEILAAAQRDGVSVSAIYNQIKRKGKMTL